LARVTWGIESDKIFSQGLDRGLVQVGEEPAIPWVGLVSVSEDPEGPEIEVIYQDGFAISSCQGRASYSSSIKAFTYPEILDDIFEGISNKGFHFSYRTFNSNGSYNLHLVYNCVSAQPDHSYLTDSKDVHASLFSLDVRATHKTDWDGLPHLSKITIDSSKASPEGLKNLEDILYGAVEEPRFPSPFETRLILARNEGYTLTPMEDTGLLPISKGPYSDLYGSLEVGLFKRPIGSRLKLSDDLPKGFRRLVIQDGDL